MANEPSVPSTGREHRRGRRTFLAVTASLSTLVMVIAGVGMGSYFWARAQIQTIGSDSSNPRSAATPDIGGPCARHACNYLLLGSDSRAGLTPAQQAQFGTPTSVTGQRSDTIIVVHIEPAQKKAIFLSFPRDLWVNIPGHGYDKINAAFDGGIEHGGAQLVAKTIREISGLQINHVLYVSLAGFEGVVNALGGVRMCVDRPMSDPLTGLNIQAGCQSFDGQTALAFVRTRHQPCDVIPDFARIGRQQQFLRAVLAKLLSAGEILRLPSLVPAVLKSIVVDQGLRNPAELAYLAGQLNGVNTGAADFRVVPTTTASIYPNGVYTSIVQMVQPQANQLFERIRDGKPLGDLGLQSSLTPPSPAVIKVAVYDKASGGKADGVLTVLSQGGFDTGAGMFDASALGTTVKQSVILFRPGRQAMADVVHGFLPNLQEVQAPKGVLTTFDVAVVIGPHYVPAPPSAPPSCP